MPSLLNHLTVSLTDTLRSRVAWISMGRRHLHHGGNRSTHSMCSISICGCISDVAERVLRRTEICLALQLHWWPSRSPHNFLVAVPALQQLQHIAWICARGRHESSIWSLFGTDLIALCSESCCLCDAMIYTRGVHGPPRLAWQGNASTCIPSHLI